MSGIDRQPRTGAGAGRSVTALLFFVLSVISSPLVAASFTVNSETDARDANAGDGVCATSIGECTLRAAIEETNALPGADTIELPSGTYLIELGDGDEGRRQRRGTRFQSGWCPHRQSGHGLHAPDARGRVAALSAPDTP